MQRCNHFASKYMINFIFNAFFDVFYICSLIDKKPWNILVLVSKGQCQNWEYSRKKKFYWFHLFFLLWFLFFGKRFFVSLFLFWFFLFKIENENALWKVEKIIQHLIKQKETFWSVFILRFFTINCCKQPLKKYGKYKI